MPLGRLRRKARLLERFKSDAANTRNEVRKELGINGQSPTPTVPHPIPVLVLFILSSWSSQFFYPPFFHFQFNCEMILNFSSLLFSLSL